MALPLFVTAEDSVGFTHKHTQPTMMVSSTLQSSPPRRMTLPFLVLLCIISADNVQVSHSFQFSPISSSSSSPLIKTSQQQPGGGCDVAAASSTQRIINQPVQSRVFPRRHNNLLLDAATTSAITIRDWEDGEGKEIFTFLQNSAAAASVDDDSSSDDLTFYDPEGPLEHDCGTENRLKESYNKEDGGCLLVAVMATPTKPTKDGGGRVDYSVDSASSGGSTTTSRSPYIVGTAALITGTSISYLKSGASISSPEIITGAIRRVVVTCTGTSSTNDDDDAHHAMKLLLKDLLTELEIRARKEKVQEIILLAYPKQQQLLQSSSLSVSAKRFQRRQHYLRPYPSLLASMGYEELPMKALAGSGVFQYCKSL